MSKYIFYIIFIIIFFQKYSLVFSLDGPKNLFINDLKPSYDDTLEVELNDRLSVHYEGWIFDKNSDAMIIVKQKAPNLIVVKKNHLEINPQFLVLKLAKGF